MYIAINPDKRGQLSYTADVGGQQRLYDPEREVFVETDKGWRHHPAGQFMTTDFVPILEIPDETMLDEDATQDHAVADPTPRETPMTDRNVPAITIAPPVEPTEDHNMPVSSCTTQETTSTDCDFDFEAATRDEDAHLAANYQELMNDHNK